MPAVLQVKQPREKLNEDQKTFRRLKNQIETLKEKERKRHLELDRGLVFYHERIRIEEEKIDRALEEQIYHTYQIYKITKSFSKRDLNSLKDLILSDIEGLLESVGIHGIPKEVEEIGKALGWRGAEATLIDEMSPMIKDIESMLASQGIKIDLSHIDVKDGEEEMTRKLFEEINTRIDQRENLSEKKSKNLQKIEELQEKSISAIYKQLAKILHPDLEPDLEKKAQKEEQMKKLTVAYVNSDLSTLLELEQEWIDFSREASAIRGSDQLKIYNEILRQQIRIIKDRMEMLFLHPRYLPIQKFYEDRFTGMDPLLKAYHAMRAELEDINSFVDQLKSPQAEKVLKRTLQQERALQEIESDLFHQLFSTKFSS